MPSYETDFTKHIKFLRATAGLTFKALSDRTGLSCSYLSDLENGCRPPTENVIARLCIAYNLDNDAQRILYDAAGSATQSLPFDVQAFLLNNPEALARVILEMEEHLGNTTR